MHNKEYVKHLIAWPRTFWAKLRAKIWCLMGEGPIDFQ